MTITTNKNGNEITLVLEGRLDTNTAPELEAEVKNVIEGAEQLVFDFTALDYLSSAGLRVLLSTQKAMSKQGKMIIKNVNDTIMEVFDITGFLDILTIE